MSNALTKLEKLPSGPISDVAALHETWQSLEAVANLVSPVASVNAIPQMHAISLRAVTIDPTMDDYGSGREVYRNASFCDKDEAALGGVALSKIAAAAGAEITKRSRLDDRTDPNYCEIEVTVSIRDFDGVTRTATKAKSLDLNDGAPEAMKPEKKKGPRDKWAMKTGNMIPLDPSALANKRAHIQSHTETKAFYRALRLLLSIKQKYTLDELSKPFVIPKLIPNLDPSDPDQKQALIASALGKEELLFGPPIALPPGETRELKDITPAPTVNDSAPSNEETKLQAEPEAPAFEPTDFPDPDPGLIYTCGCSCSCQVELTEEVARITSERYGSPRCEPCFPASGFDYDRHKDLKDLGLPKLPGLTADRVIEVLRKEGKR